MESTIIDWVHSDDGTQFCPGNNNPGTFAAPVDPDAGQVECKNCGLLLVSGQAVRRAQESCHRFDIPDRYATNVAQLLHDLNH